MASKKTRGWRLDSPSISEARKYREALERRVAVLEGLLTRAVKSEGSNLVEGRYSLIIAANPEYVRRKTDELTVTQAEDGSVTIVVEDKRLEDEGLREQVAAFQAEMAGGKG